jgi:hypothetical protein
MTNRISPVAAPAAALFLLMSILALQQHISAQNAAGFPVLKIGGDVATPLELSAADLKKMPRKTLSVVNPHDKKSEVYEGVLLQELFRRAGVPQGHQLRGPAMAAYVLAEASDGYRVVFSLAEIDSDFLDSDVIVADTNQGPFKMVVPQDKRPARWIRMLKSLTVIRTRK